MKKSMTQKILEITSSNGSFDSSVAKRKFKGYNSQGLHNSVMRTARHLSSRGLLQNNGSGLFTITTQGERVIQ